MAEAGTKRVYDLARRTSAFGAAIVRLARRVKPSAVTRPVISQVVRAGTSVGANYCEAEDAVSRKDFRHKIGLCRKESKETMYWLHMLACADERVKEDARMLWKEARQLNLIFAQVFRSTKT
jgi:four helix bundle protein